MTDSWECMRGEDKNRGGVWLESVGGHGNASTVCHTGAGILSIKHERHAKPFIFLEIYMNMNPKVLSLRAATAYFVPG